MTHQFDFLRLLADRHVRVVLLGILLFVPTASFSSGALAGFLQGLAEAGSKLADEALQQERQKKLLDYQFKLEMERLERAAQLESQRIERANQLDRERLARERAEQVRRQEEIRLEQQVAEEKKQQEAAEQRRTAISTGTGFFIAPGGYLVTNHHVIEDKTDYAVRDHKGRFYKASVIARDSNRDLALLKIEGTFPALKIISSDSVSKGQRVLAVGYPQISIQGNESKITDGIISSFSGVRNDEDWFQISVPIQGGNSGGPLVTESGGVVGVVVATANVARFYKMTGNLPQNVNYAVKSKVLLEFLKAQRLQNVSAAKGKVSIEMVDASTVLVISKNGPIDVAYTASPEQLAREKRDREIAAAKETRRQKEEALAEQKRQVEERRAEKQRSDESALMSKRDQAVLKAYPDWQEIRDSDIFVAWLAEQRKETTDKLNSPKATDVIAVIRQYHAELPRFVNRYVALVPHSQGDTPATAATVAASPPAVSQIASALPANIVAPSMPSDTDGWTKVSVNAYGAWTEVLLESVAHDGVLLLYTYREHGPIPTIFGKPTKAVANCSTRQRADVQSDLRMELRAVSPGTQQSAELDFVCQIGAASNSTAKPAVTLTPGHVVKDCADCPEMVLIGAGTFNMGGKSADEQPVRRVNIIRFLLGRTEVTQGQWKAVMGSNPSGFGSCGDDCPVEKVSWSDAQSYAQKLSQQTGKNYRLPSEAEWEYACRAGSNQEYCGGDDVNAVGWYEKNSDDGTDAVAGKQANAFGLFDMSGNVWEWVEDVWHDNYSGAPTDGSAWTSGGVQTMRAQRGGSWHSSRPNSLSSAYRSRSMTGSRSYDTGFRIARTL
jgi:formylglycine-generating enzyme required for sulfatase activity/S1-C subfamily serine protease